MQQSDQKTTQKAKSTSGRFHSDDSSRYAVTIGKKPEEVFAYWRNFENLAFFMKDIKKIKVLSEKKSHWEVQIKAGPTAKWDAEIVAERKNEMISWRSLPESEVEMTGSVWFSPAPAGRGTIVSLDLDYKVPGGKVTELVTSLLGEGPDMLIQINLARFKALMETGEIPTTEGQPSGRDEDAETIVKH